MEFNFENTATSSWIDVLQIIIWPLLIIIILLLFHKQIKVLIPNLKKISFAGFDLEISKAKEIPSLIDNEPNTINFGATSHVGTLSSHLNSIIAHIADIQAYDYIVIDIGNNDKWLTSRLFILSVVFPRICKLKQIVFVQSDPHCATKQKFIGLMEAELVPRALAYRFNEYERLINELLSQRTKNLDIQGKFNKDDALNIISAFISSVQIDTLRPLIILDSGASEHAEWLSNDRLNELVGCNLVTKAINSSWSNKKKLRRTIQLDYDFLAVVDEEGYFEYVVNRRKIILKLMDQYL